MVSACACLQSAPVTHPCLSHSPSSKNEKKKPWPYLGLSGALFLFALFQTPIHSNYPHIARMYRFVRCPACSLPIADLYSFAGFFVILDHNVARLWSCAIEMFSFDWMCKIDLILSLGDALARRRVFETQLEAAAFMMFVVYSIVILLSRGEIQSRKENSSSPNVFRFLENVHKTIRRLCHWCICPLPLFFYDPDIKFKNITFTNG